MGTLKTTNIQSISGSGTVTLGTSGETFAVGTGVSTQLCRPAFRVYNNADQTISDSTWTKITLDTEEYDTNAAFGSNKFTVPANLGGKYFLCLQTAPHVSTDYRSVRGAVYKNGSIVNTMKSQIQMNSTLFNDGETIQTITGVLDLAAADYIEGYGYIYSPGGGTLTFAAGECCLQGFRIGD